MKSSARSAIGIFPSRRRNARARLNLPARVVLLDGYCSCTVENLSRDGARIACEWDLRIGDQGILKRDGLDQLFTVKWVSDGKCGVDFDDSVSQETILALRWVADNYETHRRARLKEFGRKWVEGDNTLSTDD